MELLGYSERGLINAFFYGAKAKNNPVEIIGEFLKCLRDCRNRQFFNSTDDLSEIPIADLREKGIATRRKKLKDSFVIRRILIELLGNYRANYFSGCITADPANPLSPAKHKGYSFCWMGIHELYRIAKDFKITEYLDAADFNRDKRVFSGSVDLADLQSETMYPAVRKSYNILKKSIEEFIVKNDRALCLRLNKRSLSIKCRRGSGRVLLTLTPRVNTLTRHLQFRQAYRGSVCPHGNERPIREFLDSLEEELPCEC